MLAALAGMVIVSAKLAAKTADTERGNNGAYSHEISEPPIIGVCSDCGFQSSAIHFTVYHIFSSETHPLTTWIFTGYFHFGVLYCRSIQFSILAI